MHRESPKKYSSFSPCFSAFSAVNLRFATMQKSLDLKLARIHADPRGCKDFILADAKDPDMALSIGAPGKSPEAHSGEVRYRSLTEFRDIITQIVEEKLVDIMLMSASTSEALTIQKRIFDNSPVTPAARANDTTDIHIIRGGRYAESSVAALPHGDAGSHSMRPRRVPAAGASARRRPRPLQHHVQQRHGVRPRRAGRVQAIPPGGRAQGLPSFPGDFRPESTGGGAGEPGCRPTSTM